MDRWVTAASVLLAFLLYYNTLEAGFVYDDRRAILSNPDVIGHSPIEALFENDFWGTPLTDPGSHGSYRPLCVATYRLNYAFSGLKPWSYHFLNILFHCVATALVVTTARKILPHNCARVGTAVAGLTFAAHPIHTEAVAGVVGRADIAACNFFLLSFLLYTEHIRLREIQTPKCGDVVKEPYVHRKTTTNEHPFRLSCHGLVEQIMTNFRRLLKAGKDGPLKMLDACEVKDNIKLKCQYSDSASDDTTELSQWLTLAGTLLFAVVATLCKEPGIMVLPLCILYDFLKSARQEGPYSKRQWRSVCALGMGGFTLLYWRLRIAGAPTPFAAADNPASRDPSFLTRFYTFTYLPVFNFCLFLYPFHLSFDWSMDSIPRITTLFDSRNVLTIAFYAVISNTTWKTVRKVFNKHEESAMKASNHKKLNSKKQKWSYKNKQHNRTDASKRKSRQIPYKETTSSKKSDKCKGCNHSLTEEHTEACRAVNNNNNTMMHHSTCLCTKFNAHSAHKCNVQRCPQIALLISVAFMILAFLPASNLFFYVGFVVAERVLYIPSVGLCLLLGLGAGTLTRGWRRNEMRSRMFMFALLAALSAMCSYTLRRNLDWRDEESLFRSSLHINPPKAYGNLGSVLTEQGRTEEAEIAYQRALKHRPNMADVHYNLGILLQNQRRYKEAVQSFERAIYFRPSLALAYVNLGASLMADGRFAEAKNALHAGARVQGHNVRDRREHDAARVSSLVQLAALHSQRGHFQKALSAYHDALNILPDTNAPIVGWTKNGKQDAASMSSRVQLAALHSQRDHFQKALSAYHDALQILPDTNAPIVGWTKNSVLSMTADVYVQLKQWSDAESTMMSALNIAPKHVGTHLMLATVLARNASRAAEAETWFRKALALAPNDPAVRDQFGMFLRSQRRLRESADQLVTAAKLSPKDSARASAAAMALRDVSKCRSAERWYAKAVQLNPEAADYHSNLGAILHLNGKYTAAATSYQRALQLQPNDQVAITNLQRVRALMQQQR